MNLNKKKYIAVFVVKQEGSYSKVGEKRFKPLDNSIRFMKKTYVIDVSIPTYINRSRLFYLIDINGQQLFFEKSEGNIISPEVVDMILSRKIITELTSNLSGDKWKMSLLLVVFSAVFGGMLGFLIAGFV